MTDKDIVRECLKTLGWSQKTLADACGLGNQQAVGSRLTRGKAMNVSTFVRFMNAMGYEVTIKSKSKGSNQKFILTLDEDGADE